MKNILGILTITLVLAACDKEQKLTENLELTKNSNEFIINDSTIEKIGEYHNESLSKAFKNFDWNSDNHRKELLHQFKINDIEFDEAKEWNLKQTQEENTKENLAILEEKMSLIGFSYIQQSLELTESVKHCSSFSEDIKHLKKQVMVSYENKEISSVEVNSILVTFGILDYSARFWAPIDKGGTGEGYKILTQANGLSENSRVRFNWTKAMIGDGLSGGTGMLGVFVIGAFGGPIGWISLVSVAGNAAFASGFGGLL